MLCSPKNVLVSYLHYIYIFYIVHPNPVLFLFFCETKMLDI